MPEVTLITSFCTLAWANTFFGEYVFDENWADATDAKKTSALKAASDFISLYCKFPVEYSPDGTDDYEDAIIPRRLKQACAQEASYLLSLDDNPAEPCPITIIGILSADGKKFDGEMIPPIFSKQVVKLLERIDAIIDPESMGNERIQVANTRTTY